jgi:hypothetical protein
MEWFISIFYLLAVYGMSVIVTQGIGPFNIFFRLRMWANSVGDNFGMLFKCMLCLPTNIGWIFSLIDWFLLPDIAITPFNIIFNGTSYWWLSFIFDGALAGGFCHFLWNLDDYIDKSTPIFEDQEVSDE